MRHLLGASHDGPLAEPLPPGERPATVRWTDEIPRGKLDLLVNVDFRMTTTGLYSDVVLPAATWYEKHDLSMTDMHPFVHSFNQAVPPPWEARTDWDTFGAIARAFSDLAAEHLGVRRDIVSGPVLHDTPGEISQPRGASSRQRTSAGRSSGGNSSARGPSWTAPSRWRMKYSWPLPEEPSRLERQTKNTRGKLDGALGSSTAKLSRPDFSSDTTCSAGSTPAASASATSSSGLRSNVGNDGIQPIRTALACASIAVMPANRPAPSGDANRSGRSRS